MIQTHHTSIFSSFTDDDGQIVIGGLPATQHIDGSGRPHFLYSRSILEARIDALRQAMPEGLDLHFAVKSNPFAPFLKAVDPLVDGFDIASIGELFRLIDAGCSIENVSFAGPGKTRAEIEDAARHGVKVIVESPHQLWLCQQAGEKLNKQVRVMVRINDRKPRSGGGLSMSGGQTVFGWDLDDFQARGAHLFAQYPNVDFWGLHLFFGSQILQVNAIKDAIAASVETIKHLTLPSVPKLINIGGGLGVPYGPKDVPLELGDVTEAWAMAVDDLQTAFAGTKVCIELGRYISAPTGIYVMEVLDKKYIGEDCFVVCAGGLHHFSAATGNFGQVLKRNHPVAPTKPDTGEVETITITGPLCTPMDVFARQVSLPKLEIGDHIAVFQAGAYGATASPAGFLSHPSTVELLVD